jgi:TetR/AcrR family transcriptional regulator, mexCD-oprJ operon repressor
MVMRTVPEDTGPPPRPQRADARRNVTAILEAARASLARDPDATVADIAAAAGVGRVTLYGHFPNRAELVEAVLSLVAGEADAALAGTDKAADPVTALVELVRSTWQVVDQFHAVLQAAQQELPAESIRGHHDPHLRRIEALIRRGQRAGVFRRDLPRGWLVTLCYTVMHAAAAESAAGRLKSAEAGDVIAATILAAFTPPGVSVPAATRG